MYPYFDKYDKYIPCFMYACMYMKKPILWYWDALKTTCQCSQGRGHWTISYRMVPFRGSRHLFPSFRLVYRCIDLLSHSSLAIHLCLYSKASVKKIDASGQGVCLEICFGKLWLSFLEHASTNFDTTWIVLWHVQISWFLHQNNVMDSGYKSLFYHQDD